VVEVVAAIAAAAIASGAFALADVVCGFVGPVATGISAATGFCVTVCVSVGFAASFASPTLLSDLSDDWLSEPFVVSDFALLFFGAFLSAPELLALLAGGGLELSESSERLGGGWSGPCVLRAGLLSEAWLLLAERGGAAGSGVGGGELEGSGGRLLSTIAAKFAVSCDGSGRAGFGGAFW
jgi:hypothetical protein